MNNAVSGKTMENFRKNRNIRLVTTDKRRSYLVSEQNYHTKERVFRKFINSRNKQNKSKTEQTNLFRSVNVRNQQISNA